jgi:hypothetical protein
MWQYLIEYLLKIEREVWQFTALATDYTDKRPIDPLGN